MDERIDSLGDVSLFFTTLDANLGYFQIAMDPSTRDRTTIIAHLRMWRSLRITLGLKKSVRMKRVIGMIITTVRCQLKVESSDDFIIFKKTTKAHFNQIDTDISFLQ